MLKIKSVKWETPSTKTIINEGSPDIIVKQYLPVEQKMALIGNIVNNSADDNNYYNPIRLDMYTVIGIIGLYTDIDLEDTTIAQAYDILMESGLWEDILDTIPASEIEYIKINTRKILENIYAYKNSIYGVIEGFNNSADNIKLDSEEIQKNLSDPENLKLVKEILTKMG